MSDTQQSLLPQLAPQMYKATTDNITFSKRQQWAITNYTVLVYAGLVGLAKTFTGGASTCERIIITIFAVGTGLCAALLLRTIQRDMGKVRNRLESIHNNFLSERERQLMHIEPYGDKPWERGVWFYRALLGVVVLGAPLVIWSLWR
jgi:hypothetical protein